MSDILIRAAKTAVQTFLAAAPVAAIVGLDVPVLQAAALSGLAAGVAILHNAALRWARSA